MSLPNCNEPPHTGTLHSLHRRRERRRFSKSFIMKYEMT